MDLAFLVLNFALFQGSTAQSCSKNTLVSGVKNWLKRLNFYCIVLKLSCLSANIN